MRKKKDGNYLEKIPVRSDIPWSTDENGIVALKIENRGIFNRTAQIFFKKPKISYISLDETGSYVWQITDGKKTVAELAEEVELRFGERANPLYERLSHFFAILDGCRFIDWVR